MLTYGLVFKAILLVLGLWWCKDVLGRLRSDIAELKESDDSAHKGVIVFYWILTVGIMILLAIFVWGILSNIIGALR